MKDPLAAELASRASGPVASAADPAGYDQERRGFNLAIEHRPRIVLGAAAEADIVDGVRFAAQHDLPVGLQATGHGAHAPMLDGLLINTSRLRGVRIDPSRRIARISAGATAGAVTAAAARHGLAAPVGSAPGVGFVSYALGGGLGPYGRAIGYAADYVRRLEAVTADGRAISVGPQEHAELFWGLRGAGSGLAVVSALEIDLHPAPRLYAGGLYFPGEQGAALIDGFARTLAAAPPELTLSLAFVTFPDLPRVPEVLRGRYVGHLRVAYVGPADDARRLLGEIALAGRLRPVLDTLRDMPLTELGTIHGDPLGPMPVNSNGAALASAGSLASLQPFVRPGAPFMLEIRHLGGALARTAPDGGLTGGLSGAASDNAVGLRSACLNLFTSAYPGTEPIAAAEAQQAIVDALPRAEVAGVLRNFLPTAAPDATRCYEAGIAARLTALKAQWDPRNAFRYGPSLVRAAERSA